MTNEGGLSSEILAPPCSSCPGMCVCVYMILLRAVKLGIYSRLTLRQKRKQGQKDGPLLGRAQAELPDRPGDRAGAIRRSGELPAMLLSCAIQFALHKSHNTRSYKDEQTSKPQEQAPRHMHALAVGR